MNRGAKIVVVLLFAVSAAFGGTQDDQNDEEMLRLALAKIVFAHEVGFLFLIGGSHPLRQDGTLQPSRSGVMVVVPGQVKQNTLKPMPSGGPNPMPSRPQTDAQPLAKTDIPELERSDAMIQGGLDQHKVEFAIADVSTGPISDIRGRMADFLKVLPDGRMLEVGPTGFIHSMKESDGLVHTGLERLANVRWRRDSPNLQRVNDQALLEGIPDTCSRYITATITATYEGQIYQWKPAYLTGCNKAVRENIDVIASDLPNARQALRDGERRLREHPAVYALDPVLQHGVPVFWNADVYPYAELGARSAMVRDWLRKNASERCTTPRTTCFENGRVVIPSQDIPPEP
jgi:hypothetical protein